jgi:hypothetical protein
MSTTIHFPLASVPSLPLREGQTFRGYVKEGEVHVTVSAEDETTSKQNAAQDFIENMRGIMTRPTQEELEADPRLSYLYKKHVLCLPTDECY